MSRSTKILFLTNVLCVSSECILCFNCDLPWYASSKSVINNFEFNMGNPHQLCWLVRASRKSESEFLSQHSLITNRSSGPHHEACTNPQRWHAVHCYTRNDEFEFCLRLTSSAFIFCFALSSVIQLFYFV